LRFIEKTFGANRDKKLELAGSIRAAKAKAAADKTLTQCIRRMLLKRKMRRELSDIQEVTQESGTETAF